MILEVPASHFGLEGGNGLLTNIYLGVLRYLLAYFGMPLKIVIIFNAYKNSQSLDTVVVLTKSCD
jgi:hypothetical protein